MAPNPILILSSGQRTGSTLLQRFILSNPRIMIWGEHDGILTDILGRYDRLYEWEQMFGHQLETFVTNGYNNFIPNMVPKPEVIWKGQRAILEALYRDPALKMGRDIWGFKEVLYDANIAVRIRDLFPDVRVVFITRHPFNCFVSLLHEERLKPPEVNIPLHESWSRPKTVQWIKNWTHINETFLDHPDITDDWVFKLTYEQLIADIPNVTEQMIDWLGMDRDAFDVDVFNHRRYTDRNNSSADKQDKRTKLTWDDLSAEEALLITQPEIRGVAQRLGYDMPNLSQEERDKWILSK